MFSIPYSLFIGRGGPPRNLQRAHHVSGVREGVREPARHHVAHEDALGLRGRQATLLRHLQQDLRRQGLLQVSFGPFTFFSAF